MDVRSVTIGKATHGRQGRQDSNNPIRRTLHLFHVALRGLSKQAVFPNQPAETSDLDKTTVRQGGNRCATGHFRFRTIDPRPVQLLIEAIGIKKAILPVSAGTNPGLFESIEAVAAAFRAGRWPAASETASSRKNNSV
jgi:hypothetical protein